MLRPPRALYTQARVRVYVPQEGEGFSPRARDFLPPSPHIGRERESCRYSRASFLPAPLPLLPFARSELRLFRAPTRDRSILRAVIFARDAFARSAPCVFFSPFLRAHPLYWIPRVSRARTRTFIPRGIFFGRGAAALSGSIGPREAKERDSILWARTMNSLLPVVVVGACCGCVTGMPSLFCPVLYGTVLPENMQIRLHSFFYATFVPTALFEYTFIGI